MFKYGTSRLSADASNTGTVDDVSTGVRQLVLISDDMFYKIPSPVASNLILIGLALISSFGAIFNRMLSMQNSKDSRPYNFGNEIMRFVESFGCCKQLGYMVAAVGAV